MHQAGSMAGLLEIRNLEIRFGAAEAVVGEGSDRVAVMRAGQIVEAGNCARLLTKPEHPYTKSLLAAIPTLRTDRNRPLAIVGD